MELSRPFLFLFCSLLLLRPLLLAVLRFLFLAPWTVMGGCIFSKEQSY